MGLYKIKSCCWAAEFLKHTVIYQWLLTMENHLLNGNKAPKIVGVINVLVFVSVCFLRIEHDAW